MLLQLLAPQAAPWPALLAWGPWALASGACWELQLADRLPCLQCCSSPFQAGLGPAGLWRRRTAAGRQVQEFRWLAILRISLATVNGLVYPYAVSYTSACCRLHIAAVNADTRDVRDSFYLQMKTVEVIKQGNINACIYQETDPRHSYTCH